MPLSPKDSLDAIRRHLDDLEAERPSIVNARDRFRDASRSKAHCAFRASVDALIERGWSKRAIARRLDVDVVSLIDWYERGDRKRSQIPGWVLAALPSEARAAWMRVALGWSDVPPPSTGTDG
jgi:hypothetical protein